MLSRAAIVLVSGILLGCAAAPAPAAAPPAPPEEGAPPRATAEATPTVKPPGATEGVVPAAALRDTNDKASQLGRAGSSVVPTDAPLLTGITQEQVLAQVQKHMELFDKCYAIGAATSKNFRAKVTVKATVGPTGSVNAAEIIRSTSNNPKVDACVADAFHKLSFARPAGAGTTVFTFPLSYEGVEQVK